MNTASFTVGEAAEYFENKVKSYLHYISDNGGSKVSLASLVDGINWDGEASYSSTCLLAISKLFASDEAISRILSHRGSLDNLKKLNTEHAQICADVFERFVGRFFFLSNRDEDMSGKRWGDDMTVPWSLVSANAKGLSKTEESFEELLKSANACLNAPPKTVQSRETEQFRNAMDSVCESVNKHLTKHSKFHCDKFTVYVQSLRKLLHLKEQIHTVYTVNNFHARRAFVAAAFSAGLGKSPFFKFFFFH